MPKLTAITQAAVLALFIGSASQAATGQLPPSIQHQLPAGYSVLSYAAETIDADHAFYFVALAARNEASNTHPSGAPARPLLIYQLRSSGQYSLAGRNDQVILGIDDGGYNRCDPFEDGHIATKGSYFTVENGVACGDHWTDYVTFRFDPRTQGYIFDNQRNQSWSMNPSNDPNAEALILDGHKTIRAPKGREISFSQWRRAGPIGKR
jgi:hypothetical protein